MDLRRDSQEDTSESPGFSRGEEVKSSPCSGPPGVSRPTSTGVLSP